MQVTFNWSEVIVPLWRRNAQLCSDCYLLDVSISDDSLVSGSSGCCTPSSVACVPKTKQSMFSRKFELCLSALLEFISGCLNDEVLCVLLKFHGLSFKASSNSLSRLLEQVMHMSSQASLTSSQHNITKADMTCRHLLCSFL